MGTVKWIGVKKGDEVKKGDVIVSLEDDEYRARVMETEGRLALADANLTNAEVNLKRQIELSHKDVDSVSALDDAQRVRDGDVAEVKMARGQLALAQTYLDWCTIHAPIGADGDLMVRKLARRLVDVDLLSQAAGTVRALHFWRWLI